MKHFILSIDIEKAAFEHRPADEVARILREVADQLELVGTDIVGAIIRDINGNFVGSYGTD